MKINKITTGFVIQTFDTTLNKYISQQFVASDETVYEYQNGATADSSIMTNGRTEPYIGFDMVQPA